MPSRTTPPLVISTPACRKAVAGLGIEIAAGATCAYLAAALPSLEPYTAFRIGALAATNYLLTKSVQQIADLRDILEAEPKPHGEGPHRDGGRTVALAPELARAPALVFHELTTNAAKHGALSRPEGRLLVRWRVLADRVRINWIESGGAPVAPTRERGFGMILLEKVLDSHQGGRDRFPVRWRGLRHLVRFAARVATTSVGRRDGADVPLAEISIRCLEAKHMRGLDFDIGRSQVSYERFNCAGTGR